MLRSSAISESSFFRNLSHSLFYRREDSSASAGRLFDIQRNHFAANQIFMDEKEERLDAERHKERAPRVLEKATKEQPWQNSLGMKFVPVAGTQVLFNIWDTRLEDFHAFVESAGYDATEGMYTIGKDGWKRRGATWKEPGFKQGPTYPVVGVSWNDVKAFCEWLTKRERGSGALPESMHYRLPTDTEWSVAVGLDSEPGNTPEEKSSKINLYPWGTMWPPPSGSGNYCGEEARIRNEPEGWPVIQGYNDGFPRTSPVGCFAANKNGVYNMGGNVWQWCEDWYIRRINTVCCAVRRGAMATPTFCSHLFAASARPLFATMSSAFVVVVAR